MVNVRALAGPGDRPRVPSVRSGGSALRSAYHASPLYFFRLIGRNPDDLTISPPNPWPGDARRGNEIIVNSAVFDGEPAPIGKNWVALDHTFGWLGDLRVVGSDEARRRARQLVRAWIFAYGKRPSETWQPEALGERIVNWLNHYVFFCASADYGFRALFFQSLARQSRHLARVAEHGAPDARRLLSIKGWIYVAVCLPGFDRMYDTALGRLRRELDRQILADGGHFERSPSQHLAVLRDLVDIRATLAEAGRDVPAALQSAIDRMAPVLKAFRHGDGGLALFNGSQESQAALVDLVLEQSGALGSTPTGLPHTGFQRFTAGRTTIIMDAGRPARPHADALSHAGTLAFEMSVGRTRLIVNCGSCGNEDVNWRKVCRTTAAHSTLVVDDTNSSELLFQGGLGLRPETITCRRQEDAGTTTVKASHDGYKERFGLVHHRKLRLSPDGKMLEGADELTGHGSGQTFALRFHLHPNIAIAGTDRRNEYTLILPGEETWLLQVAGGEATLEQSVYLGRPGDKNKALQVVVTGPIEAGGLRLIWRLSRVA